MTDCENKRIQRVQNTDNGEWLFLRKSDLRKGHHHTEHISAFGKYVRGYNYYIVKSIDIVQTSVPTGGDLKTQASESPIGYELKIFGKSLINPMSQSSNCRGATYAVLIEGLNLIFGDGALDSLDFEHYEALRMQEIHGESRTKGVKFWGNWNTEDFGNQFALVQYSGIGKEIEPRNARPGDFMNIAWKKGVSSSVIFLGWYRDKEEKISIVYWSSQKETDGFGDQIIPIDRIKNVKVVRLTSPENLFRFNINNPVSIKVPGVRIEF